MLDNNLFLNYNNNPKLIHSQNMEKTEYNHKDYFNILRFSFKIFLKKCEEALYLNEKIIEPQRQDYQVNTIFFFK